MESAVPLVVIPCTFKPHQEGEFRMSFESAQPIVVAPVDSKLEYRIYTQEGKWEGPTAGGCKNHPTVTNNPQYSLECEKAMTVTVTLSQTSKEPFDTIGLYVCKSKAASEAGDLLAVGGEGLGPGLSPVVKHKSGGSKREALLKDTPSGGQRIKALSSKIIVAKSEFSSALEAHCVFKASPKYTYTIIPCTFEQGRESNFTLSVFTKRRAKLKSLNQESGNLECDGQWHDESAGGCVNYPTWRNNPQYFLYCKRDGTQVQITLTQKRALEPYAIGLYVARNSSSSQSRLLVLSAENLVGKTTFEKSREVSITLTLDESDVSLVVVVVVFLVILLFKF